jgi:hypothetical protein
MQRTLVTVIAFALVGAVTAPSEESPRGQSTVVGWFTCDRCAPAARVKAKHISPANRECVQKCVSEGAGLVFLDEKARAVLRVSNPQAAKGQESHYVQVTGTIDAPAHTLTVSSVNVLKEYVAKCGRPEK